MSLILGSGNDTLNAGSGNDEIYAGAGNDKVSAGAGNDFVDGGSGNDNLDGGSGTDTLLGGVGNDTLDGNTGNDTVDGGAGSDTVRGGAGDDLAIYALAENGIADVDRYQGGSGDDTILLRFTLAEWERADVQSDIARYIAFLNEHAAQGELGQKFQFSAFNLETQQFEHLRITVDGVEIDPVGNDNLFLKVVDDTGGVTEDEATPTLSDSGTITFDDFDLTDSHITSVDPDAGNTLGGSLTAEVTDVATGAGDGTVTWTYTVDNAATQYLADGETVTEKFTITIDDQHGGTVDQLVTVTITGTNDEPTISVADDAGEVTEDTTTPTLSDTGTITFDDVDLIDSHITSVDPDAGNTLGGSLTAEVTDVATGAGDGTVTWTYTVDNAATQYLADGETVTEKFTITIDDQHGGTVDQLVTVTITGTNDEPTISVADDAGGVTEDATTPTLSDTGTITFDDVDLIDSHITSVDPDAGNTLGGILTAEVTDVATGAGDGTVTWTYTVDNAATQYLADGETVTETFTITIDDQNGGTVDQLVMVTITGTNDEPTISVADDAGGVTEDADATTLTDTGTITFDDVDLIDSHVTSVDPDAGNTLGGSLTAEVTDVATGAGNGTVTWTYTVDNAATQYLADGETVTEKFTITIDDQNGGTIEQLVTVTVTGVNDAPVISVVTTDRIEAELDETNAGLSASGTLTVNDVDVADTVSSTVFSVAASGVTVGLGLTDDQLLAMMTLAPLSALAADTGDTHNLTWTFDSNGEAFNYLGAGETLTLTYTIKSTDDSLWPLSDTQTVTVIINGTADGSAAVAVADNVITDITLGNAIPIPEWALLANDTGGAADVASVGSAINGSVVHTPGSGDGGTVTFSDTAPAGGSFAYTPSDGTSPGTPATVTVAQDAVGTLDGTAGDDILVSTNSSSTLIGGGGDDILLGGDGNDTYRFGLSDGTDMISDTSGGNDAIQISTASPTNSTQIGVLNFERVGSDLVIDVGATEITVRGHYAGTSVESIAFTNGGTVYGYTLSTGSYSLSTDAIDPLNGTGSADVIASSSGVDSLLGGNGNDLLFGNGDSDTITGGSGNDLIVGGLGNDILSGGLGSDVFVFNTALNAATNVDSIGDFNADAADRIVLDHLIFSGIGTGGTLAAGDFASVSNGVTGTAAASVNILYDSTNNRLYFDSDGADTTTGRTLFANVTISSGIFDNNDIFVV